MFVSFSITFNYGSLQQTELANAHFQCTLRTELLHQTMKISDASLVQATQQILHNIL